MLVNLLHLYLFAHITLYDLIYHLDLDLDLFRLHESLYMM
jgi:hypothetical protein